MLCKECMTDMGTDEPFDRQKRQERASENANEKQKQITIQKFTRGRMLWKKYYIHITKIMLKNFTG